MTRGRKKDLTIPPSRALAQQRDYRARKAQYVSDLEARCQKAELENAQLRRELELARAGGHPPLDMSPEMAQASSELARHLGAASESLARFQQVAFSAARPQPRPSSSISIQNLLRPASFPSPAPSPPFSTASATPANSRVIKRPRTLSRSPSPAQEGPSRSTSIRSSSPDAGSDCCWGIVSCPDPAGGDVGGEDDRRSLSPPRDSSNNWLSASEGTGSHSP